MQISIRNLMILTLLVSTLLAVESSFGRNARKSIVGVVLMLLSGTICMTYVSFFLLNSTAMSRLASSLRVIYRLHVRYAALSCVFCNNPNLLPSNALSEDPPVNSYGLSVPLRARGIILHCGMPEFHVQSDSKTAPRQRGITKGCTRSTQSGGCEVVRFSFVPGEPSRYHA